MSRKCGNILEKEGMLNRNIYCNNASKDYSKNGDKGFKSYDIIEIFLHKALNFTSHFLSDVTVFQNIPAKRTPNFKECFIAGRKKSRGTLLISSSHH